MIKKLLNDYVSLKFVQIASDKRIIAEMSKNLIKRRLADDYPEGVSESELDKAYEVELKHHEQVLNDLKNELSKRRNDLNELGLRFINFLELQKNKYYHLPNTDYWFELNSEGVLLCDTLDRMFEKA